MDEYCIRIVVLDYYMSPPIRGLDVMYSEFRSSSVNKVPVLRCFGSTSGGQKVCVHIHGVFPYIYIPYDESENANILMYQIASNLDKAINISMNQTASNAQHVYKIQLISGIPMYGYHSKKHQFFKVYLYNPLLVSKVSALLQNDQILGRIYQPHESHLNFTLQFMIDYNLHGMSTMKVSNLKFRGCPNDINNDSHLPPDIHKITNCELEGDVLAENILNRQEIADGGLSVNPGIAALWEDERHRRRIKNEDSQLSHFLEMDRTNIPPTNSHLIYKKALLDRLAILSDEQKSEESSGNLSVYPAETPENSDIQNASLVDLHMSSSLEMSLDETVTLSQNTDTLNVTMDEDAQDLVEILEKLGKNTDDNLAEDSILSQVVKEEDDSIEDQLDMTMPLEAMTTPQKMLVEGNISDDSSDENDGNITLIPQLDGLADNEHDEPMIGDEITGFDNHEQMFQENTVEKEFQMSSEINVTQNGRDMPSLNIGYSAENFENKTLVVKLNNLDIKQIQSKNSKTTHKKVVCGNIKKKYRKISVQEKLEAELKKIFRKVRKLNEKDRIKQIMKVIWTREHRTNKMLNICAKAKFNIVPQKRNKENNRKGVGTPSLLAEILKQTHNYVDPSLHFKVTYPNSNCFLYYYKGSEAPNVLQLPDEQMGYQQPYHSYYLRIRDREKLRKTYENMCAPDSGNDSDDPEFKCYYVKPKKVNRESPTKDISTLIYYKYLLKDSNLNEWLYDSKETYLFSEKHLQSTLYKTQKANLNEAFEEVKRKLQEHVLLNICITKNQLCNDENNFNQNVNCEPLFFSNLEERQAVFSKIKCLRSDSESDQKNISKLCDTVIESSPFFSNSEERKATFSNIKCLSSDNKDEDHIYYSPVLSLTNEHEVPAEINSISTQVEKCDINNNFSENDKSLSLESCPPRYFKEEIQNKNSEKIVISSVYVIRPKNIQGGSSRNEEQNVTGNLDNTSIRRNYKDCTQNALLFKFEDPAKFMSKYALDGANDSSSEDDVKKEVKNKKTIKRLRSDSPKYSQLPVSIASTSKVDKTKKSKGHKNDILEVNTSDKICEQKPTFLDSKSKKSLIVQTKYCDSVKRKLDFLSSVHHNVTISEEDLLCKYSPSTKNTVTRPTEKNSSDSESSFSQNNEDNSISSDSDMFYASDNEQIESFFKKHNFNLTTSEIYDFKKKFEPEAGPSKKFTPNDPTINQPSQISPKNYMKVPQYLSGSSKSNDNIFANDDIFEKSLNDDCRIYSTFKKPPTNVEVEQSLDSLKLPHVIQQEPYYSNVEDVTGPVEIGYNVLKVGSKTTADLMEFESTFDGLNQLRKTVMESTKWNRNSFKNLSLSFCEDKRVIIKPVRKSPSFKEVENWIRENAKVATPVRNIAKIIKKVSVPLSPNKDGEPNSLSLSLSSYTPTVSNSPGKCEEDNKMCLRKSILSDSSNNKSCEITGVTQHNTFGFNQSVQNFQNAKAIVEHQHLTILVVELHIRTRGDLKPNPELDPICSIFYSILNDIPDDHPKRKKVTGVVAVNAVPLAPKTKQNPILDGVTSDCDITYVDTEENLINEFLKLLNYWDPDILAGYEIQLLSWGYIIERAYILSINLVPLLGRSKISIRGAKEQNDPECITGRIVLDIWRLMRHEIAVQSYTFESMVYHILHKRVPMYSFKELSFWWDHKTYLYRYRTVEYYLFRVETIWELFDNLDLIGRTSELARLFGIQFYEVLSRGSQFRVESMMLRLAKPLNFIPVSPSVSQRAQMNAPEYIPLVMEPESKLYNDPVIVLDFQSLYPSIIIAYNYCFTSCVGRVECLGKNNQFKFGATNLKIPRKIIERLIKRDLLNFSPCGVGFVKNKVRDGILPKMLREILDTRLMVKNSMKENKGDKLLQKVLHNRQLGLKLIANVTYGYTAANFSGRMCCVEVGDSVVSKGRETLQKAIALVDNTPEWGARVVYGDTDSLFVLVPGKTRRAAFEVGEKIAKAVTDNNPDPVKLKLEKVYQPCILQTKKRYVGYMYESPDQKEPVYDAKGIETVRRDGCPAVAKVLEKCLRLLFETKDVSLIKKYVVKQFSKIISGRASIQNLTFAKEYRGFSGYKPGACVPALELSKKWTAVDKLNEPRCGERVPYVIVNGPPGFPLIRLVRSPRDLLEDPSLRPNAIYYITKVIVPPLNRCLTLIGADVMAWFNQMPRRVTHALPTSSPTKKSTISQYFATTSCASCGVLTQVGLCDNCCAKPQETYLTLMDKLVAWEQNSSKTGLFCQSCVGFLGKVPCISLDCPILYRRIQTSQDLQQTTYVRELLSSKEYSF